MKLDENLAAVHAYLCADGYVIKNPETQKKIYYMIGFRNTNLVLLKDFQKRFEKVFGLKPHLIGGQRCRIGSKNIYEKLTKDFGSFYSWEWRMPKLDKKSSKIWLRAYFDCEGWVFCKSHQNRMIGVDCVNKMGIMQVKKALENLGINSRIKKRSTRNIFSLAIFGKENLIRFKEKIGFLHPDKDTKLRRVLADFVDYDWDYPKDKKELKKFLKSLLIKKVRIKGDSGIIRIISKKENNLLILQKELNRLLDISSVVSKRINGIGTVYFELSINKLNDIKKVVDNNLLNKEQKEKWLKIKLKK